MGRTSKFSFPVPSRKNRNSQIQPLPTNLPSATFSSKAQQILGSGQQSIPPSHHRRRSSVASSIHWETASASAISVAISETTVTSQTTIAPTVHGLTVLAEDTENHNWDNESAIVPPYARSNRHLSIAPSIASIASTDASSILRRSPSSSTITSYYDKSRVPLSVSQQTSSSAMAKGLPNKASAILNMEGNAPHLPKRKHSMLKISNFVRGKRSQSSLRSDAGIDASASHASLASAFPHTAPATREPPQEQTRHHRLGRKLLDAALQPNRNVRPSPSNQSLSSQQTTTEINSLYDHYERMTFRDLQDENGEMMDDELKMEDLEELEEEDMMAAPQYNPPRSANDMPAHSRTHLSPAHPSRHSQQPVIQGPTSAHEYFNPHLSVTPRADADAGDDCSASLSSRVTKASKVSKTSVKKSSMMEADLQERSMLSLSSDSEDDSSVFSAAKPSARQRASICTSLSSDVSIHTSEDRVSSLTRSSSRKSSTKLSSFTPGNAYLTIPHDQPLPRVPRQATRPTSSLCSSPRSLTSTGNQSLPPSAVEAVMASSAKCATNLARSHSRQVLESPGEAPKRALPAIPPTRSMSIRSTSTIDAATPPLSPVSSEFSIPAGDSRIMAVTRQEELLLAALRQKRARMRENIISELEEGGMASSKGRSSLAEASARNNRMSVASRSSNGTTGNSNSRSQSFSRNMTPAPMANHMTGPAEHGGDFFPCDRKPSLTPSVKKERIMLFLNPTEDAGEVSDGGAMADESDDDISSDDFFRLPEPPRHTYTTRRLNSTSGAGAHAEAKMALASMPVRVALSSNGSDSGLMAADIPRPDSPISRDVAAAVDAAAEAAAEAAAALARRKAARLSAVGNTGGIPFWGDDD